MYQQMDSLKEHVSSSLLGGGSWDSNGFENCPYNWTETEAMIQCVQGEVLNNSDDLINCCIPLHDNLSRVAGILCIVVALVGLVGNLLTLLTVPWASRNNLFGFNTYPGRYTNIFIVNLALADFLYCLINLPLYSLQYLKRFWVLGHEACKISAAFRNMNASAVWMSVGFVAFSRCLSLQNRQLCRKCLYGARGIAVCCLIWVYGIIMVIPSFIGAYGQFGYNRKLGKCDYLENNDGFAYGRFNYGIAFFCPLLLLVGSYFLIWRRSRESSQYLRNLAYENRQQLDYRDHRLTVMILFVCGCYVLFVGPIAIIKLVDVKVTLPGLDLIFHVLYWLQYSLNFFIYALRNEQFRKAYKLFILFGLKKYCCSSGSERAPHTPIFLINPNLPGTRDNQSVLRPDLPAELAEREIVEQFNCDIELLGRSIRSYVEHAGSQTIIILPGRLSDSILEQLMRENQSCAKKIKKKNNKKSVRFYSEGEVLQSRNTEKNINHSCPGHF